VTAVVVAAGSYLAWLASRQWFMLDDFAFLMKRTVTLVGPESLLRPHNDHWVTIPILLYRSLFHLVGLHYLPYGLATIGMHLVSCVFFALLLRRLGADPWVVVLMVAMTAFLGPGALDILWDFQMGFLGALALGFVCLWLVERTDPIPRWPVVFWVVLVASLMFSGAGVTVVAWVAAYTWFRRGLRPAVVVAIVPTIVYVAWFSTYGRNSEPAPPTPAGRILPFVLRGLTSGWDAMLPVPHLGLLVLVVTAAAAVLARRHPGLRALAGASLVALVLFYLLLAVRRGGWGVASAASTRYLYIGLVLTLPGVALALQLVWARLAPHPLPRAAVWVVLIALFVTSGAAMLTRQGRTNDGWTKELPAQLVAALQLRDQGAPLLSTEPVPDFAPDIEMKALARPEMRSKLPRLDPSRSDLLQVASTLQVRVSRHSLGLPLASGVRVARMTSSSAVHGSCRTLEAHAGALVELPVSAEPSQVRLTVAGKVMLTELARHGRHSEHWPHKVKADVVHYVGTSAPDARLVITVPHGQVTLCTTGAITTDG
jgi:hypothetical protein